MSRLFDGVDDQMTYSSSPPQLTGALTMLIVLKIVVTSDTTWLSFLEGEGVANAARASIGRRNNGEIYYSNGFGLQSAISITDSDGWMVVAATRAAGTATPRAHKCIIGGANTHTNMGGTLGDEGSSTTVLRIAGNEDFANIKVAAAAEWAGTVLSDGDIEGISTAATTQSILDLSPTWCVDDSDAFVTDLAGSSDRSSVVGTADDADDPSGWVYFGGGAGATEDPFPYVGAGYYPDQG